METKTPIGTDPVSTLAMLAFHWQARIVIVDAISFPSVPVSLETGPGGVSGDNWALFRRI